MTTPVLHHIALSVHDIDKSADWYTRLFDLTLVAEVEDPAPMKIFMTPQGQAIDLRQDPAVAPRRSLRSGLVSTMSASSAPTVQSSTPGSPGSRSSASWSQGSPSRRSAGT